MKTHIQKAHYRFILALLALSLCMIHPVTASAKKSTGETETEAEAGTTVKKKKKKRNKWEKIDGYIYYWNEKGKKTKGLKKIGKYYYLFDKKGRQQHGWHKIDGSCYFFYLYNGRKGYMARKTNVNGFHLKKNGTATVSDGDQKMYCLLQATSIVEANTKPTWSKSLKMRTVWNYMQNNFWYSDVKYYYSSTWGAYYGYLCFSQRGGSCEGLGCAWAFLANACGAKNCYCVCSGGHGWAEVNGLAYDPACARYDYMHSNYYGLPSYMWGAGTIPNYRLGGYRYPV